LKHSWTCESGFTITIDGLDEGEFTEGHEFDRKWQLPKATVGRRLSQEKAKRLLANFE